MKLTRLKTYKKAIIGVLHGDNGELWFTLENAYKALPKGKYKVQLCHSPKFGCDLPLIWNDNVSKSRGIRIHAGNSYGDSQGCVLVGQGCNLLTQSLTYSQNALNDLYGKLDASKVYDLEID